MMDGVLPSADYRKPVQAAMFFVSHSDACGFPHAMVSVAAGMAGVAPSCFT
jgi:hypothetical protein